MMNTLTVAGDFHGIVNDSAPLQSGRVKAGNGKHAAAACENLTFPSRAGTISRDGVAGRRRRAVT